MNYSKVQTRQTRLICHSELGVYVNPQDNTGKLYLTMINHRFSLKELKDKVYCHRPAKSVILEEFFLKVVFTKCRSCALCKQTETEMR